jgi:hypothetical protein
MMRKRLNGNVLSGGVPLSKMMPILTILLIFLTSSCSWITDFVVSNRSSESIRISYTLQRIYTAVVSGGECPKLQHKKPRIAPADQVRRLWIFPFGWYWGPDHWDEMPSEQFQYREDSCEISLSLTPNTSVIIGSSGTYTGPDPDRLQYIDFTGLSIATKSGRIAYENYELIRKFHRVSDTLYEFEYN